MPRLLKYMRNDANSEEQAVDGSVTPMMFKLVPPEGWFIKLHRVILQVEDNGSFDSGSYGNGITLTNGIKIGVYRTLNDELILDALDGNPIFKNTDWARLTYDKRIDSYGSGTQTLSARWSFDRFGGPATITPDEYLGIQINDDLTGLVSQTTFCQGLIERL